MKRFILATALAIAAIEQPLLFGRGSNITTAKEIIPTSSIAQGKTAKFYYKQGIEKIKLGDYRGAIADYNKAIELNPDDAAFYFNRGSATNKLGDYQGAIADYTKAIEINPKYGAFYYNRGVAKNFSGDPQGACIDVRKAYSLGYKRSLKFVRNKCL